MSDPNNLKVDALPPLWSHATMTVANAAARSCFADNENGSPMFKRFIIDYMWQPSSPGTKAESGTQFLAKFFQFHVRSHASSLTSSQLPNDAKTVDLFLADLSQLAFESIVNSRKDRTLAGLIFPQQQRGEFKFELKAIKKKFPAVRITKQKKLNEASLGLIETVPGNNKLGQFSDRPLAEYLAALYLSSQIWWELNDKTLLKLPKGDAKAVVVGTISNAVNAVNNCSKWKETLEALPLTANVVKLFFGLFPIRVDSPHHKNKPGWRDFVDELVNQFFKSYHGYALVHRYLILSRDQIMPQINRNVKDVLEAAKNRSLPKLQIVADWQLPFIETAHESGKLSVAQSCLTDALFNESFYGAQAFQTSKNSSDKLHYVMLCLASLLRVGNSFCNLEFSGLNIVYGTHLKLLVEQTRGVKDLSLEAIDFSGNWGLPLYEGDRYLGEFLCSCSHLTTLNLKDCNIEDANCDEIFTRSSVFMPLDNLDLGKNSITSIGCQKLLKNLVFCHGLTTLCLASNRLTQECCSELGKFISKSLLRSLDLSDNEIGNEGAERIVLASLKSVYLTEVKLRSTGITPDFFLPEGKTNVNANLLEAVRKSIHDIVIPRDLAIDVEGILDQGRDGAIGRRLREVAIELTRAFYAFRVHLFF